MEEKGSPSRLPWVVASLGALTLVALCFYAGYRRASARDYSQLHILGLVDDELGHRVAAMEAAQAARRAELEFCRMQLEERRRAP